MVLLSGAPAVPWRNGSASDSSSEGCRFKSCRFHDNFFFCFVYASHRSPSLALLSSSPTKARALLSQETESLTSSMGGVKLDDYERHWSQSLGDIAFIPSQVRTWASDETALARCLLPPLHSLACRLAVPLLD